VNIYKNDDFTWDFFSRAPEFKNIVDFNSFRKMKENSYFFFKFEIKNSCQKSLEKFSYFNFRQQNMLFFIISNT